MERRIENGRPILIEAAVCEMAVTVEHRVSVLLPRFALGGRVSPALLASLSARGAIAEPLLDLEQSR